VAMRPPQPGKETTRDEPAKLRLDLPHGAPLFFNAHLLPVGFCLSLVPLGALARGGSELAIRSIGALRCSLVLARPHSKRTLILLIQAQAPLVKVFRQRLQCLEQSNLRQYLYFWTSKASTFVLVSIAWAMRMVMARCVAGCVAHSRKSSN